MISILSKIAISLNFLGYFLLINNNQNMGIFIRFISDLLFLSSINQLYIEMKILSIFYLIVDAIYLISNWRFFN